MIVRSKSKKTSAVERKRYKFIVRCKVSDEVVGEYDSFPAIPGRFCDEEKYRIIYREEK